VEDRVWMGHGWLRVVEWLVSAEQQRDQDPGGAIP
jgi:hypothetical protein